MMVLVLFIILGFVINCEEEPINDIKLPVYKITFVINSNEFFRLSNDAMLSYVYLNYDNIAYFDNEFFKIG